MRRSENSSRKAMPVPVVRPSTCPPRVIAGQKMEVPAWHVDRACGGRETETDEAAVDILQRMDDLLRFDDLRQWPIGRLLLGLAADRDGAESPIHARGEHTRGAIGQRIERCFQ